MATATKKKPASSGSSSSRKSSSSARKTTANSSTKTDKPAATEEAKLIEAIRDKRASYDQPVVDTPVPVLDVDPEVVGLDGSLCLAADGQTVKVSVGGGKPVTLDSEGIKAAQRAFSKAGAAF